MAIDEGRLNNVIGKRGDQRLGFPSLHSLDPGAIVAHDIEAFAPGYGMSPDDRMGDRRIAIYFRLSGRNGPLAPSKVKHRAAPVEVPPHALGKASHAAAVPANSVSPRPKPNSSGISNA